VTSRVIAGLLLLLFSFAAGARAQETQPEPGGDDGPGVEDPFREDARELEARTLFEAGRLAFEDGRFEDALASFERAHRLSNRSLLLFNIGACLDRLQRHAEAIDAFERYLEAQPEAANRAEVEARVGQMRAAAEREREREEALRQEEERRAALQAELDASQAKHVAFYQRWWFWTIVAAVAIGAGVAIGFALYDPGQGDVVLGTTGQAWFTLRSAP
jgi:tetratricopeptide (TPR) repeat protein